MISYTYCGYTTDRYNRTALWGVLSWNESGEFNSYFFWGSPEKLQLRKYKYPGYKTYKKTCIPARIKEKRKEWSGYTEITDKVSELYPNLSDQISMQMLVRKLKK